MNSEWDAHIELMEIKDKNIRKRCCCNCGNNIKIKDEKGMVSYCKCTIDGHYIGYVACFEDWCRRWKRDRKWDK